MKRLALFCFLFVTLCACRTAPENPIVTAHSDGAILVQAKQLFDAGRFAEAKPLFESVVSQKSAHSKAAQYYLDRIEEAKIEASRKRDRKKLHFPPLMPPPSGVPPLSI